MKNEEIRQKEVRQLILFYLNIEQVFIFCLPFRKDYLFAFNEGFLIILISN